MPTSLFPNNLFLRKDLTILSPKPSERYIYMSLALVWTSSAKSFVSTNTGTITQICTTYIKTTNLITITKGSITTFHLNSCAVRTVVTRYALSQHESRDNYNQGWISSESINYWQAMFSGARFLGRYYEQTCGQLYGPTSQRMCIKNTTGWQKSHSKTWGKASE
jgi:hypothetical protein